MDFTIFEGGLGPLLYEISIAPWEYVAYFLLASTLYYFLYRRYVFSIFDPFFWCFFGSVWGVADVLFMYMHGMISENLPYGFFQFVITEVAFCLGIHVFRPVRKAQFIFQQNGTSKLLYSRVFYVSSVLFLAIQVISFSFIGVPALAGPDTARLAFYSGSGGLGIIPILSDALLPVVLFFSLDKLALKHTRWTEKLFIATGFCGMVMFCFGTGAKSAVLGLVIGEYFYSLYYIGRKSFDDRYREISNAAIKAKMNKMFLVAFVSALLILYLSGSDNVLLSLLVRLIGYGDIYAHFYYIDFSTVLTTEGFLHDNIASLLAQFRLIDYEDIPLGVSQQILSYLSGHLVADRGPNLRHNVQGVVYFGFLGSIIFSFLIGCAASYLRNRCFHYLKQSLLRYIVYYELLVYASSFMAGGLLGSSLSSFVNFLIINGFVYTCVCLFSKLMTRECSPSPNNINMEGK